MIFGHHKKELEKAWAVAKGFEESKERLKEMLIGDIQKQVERAERAEKAAEHYKGSFVSKEMECERLNLALADKEAVLREAANELEDFRRQLDEAKAKVVALTWKRDQLIQENTIIYAQKAELEVKVKDLMAANQMLLEHAEACENMRATIPPLS
jgi:uncharacterized protein YukE